MARKPGSEKRDASTTPAAKKFRDANKRNAKALGDLMRIASRRVSTALASHKQFMNSALRQVPWKAVADRPIIDWPVGWWPGRLKYPIPTPLPCSAGFKAELQKALDAGMAINNELAGSVGQTQQEILDLITANMAQRFDDMK